MADISNSHVLDVTMEELPENFRELVQQACEQFQQKCLMSFSKNKSNKVIQKQSLPRVLLPHQTDYTEEEDAHKMAALVYKAMGETMTNHHTAFLNTFQAIMVNTFGPTADKYFEENAGPISGSTLFNVSKHQKKPAEGEIASASNKGGPVPNERQPHPTYG
jgi:hypothetical protein